MGIKNLKYVVKRYAPQAIKDKQLIEYSYKTIAIDTSIYLYQYIYKYGENFQQGLIKQSMRLLKNNIIPLYIFDGKPPKAKDGVLCKRNIQKKILIKRYDAINQLIKKKSEERSEDQQIEAESGEDKPITLEDLQNIEKQLDSELEQIKDTSEKTENELENLNIEDLLEEAEKINKKIICVNSQTIKDAKDVFLMMGIPFLIADGEAEPLCAKLTQLDLATACLSEDTDILANGGKKFLINFKPNSNKVTEYDLDNILYNMHIDYDKFLDLCILSGCDYTSSIVNIGPVKALAFLKKHYNIENIILKECSKKPNYFIVPSNFDYQHARDLFKNSTQKEDFEKIGNNIGLKSPQVDKLIETLSGKLPENIKKDLKRNLAKYSQNIRKKIYIEY